MTEPKFTPGPWRRTITTVPNVTEGYDTSPDIVNLTIGDRNIQLAAFGMNSTAEMREFFWKMVANADLMAASPELYDNDEKNLKLLKTILKCYEDVEKLMLIDKDVQAAIQNENIKGIMMPEVVHLITEDLKTRIAETERVLAKARGEQP